MHNIAVITARGGSKRIPKKNIKEFCGKPIMAYSIEAALKSGIFETVMVSTDDEEIARVAREYGAEVPFLRSAETSDDYATTKDVLAEVLNEYEKIGRIFDIVTCIYPTAPFVTAEKLDEGLRIFIESEADTLFPVIAFSYPPQRAMHLDGDFLKMVYPENVNVRSQDLDKHYHDAGQFYIIKASKIKQNKELIEGKVIPYIVSELEAQDIDNIVDWQLAEIKYKIYEENQLQRSFTNSLAP